MLREFRIHEPQTVEEASGLLSEHGFEAAVYAGGTELLLLMKEGLVHYPHLVNIKTVPGLDELSTNGDVLTVGPLVTHRTLERSDLLKEHVPLLAKVESTVANIRVRAAGTLGGNLCFAEPHSDPATFLTAWGATLELTSAGGRRQVPIDEFFVDVLQTARQPDEILTAVRLPLASHEVLGAYEKFATHERPTATIAAVLFMDDGIIEDARIAVGSVGPVPIRVPKAEEALEGEKPGDAVFAAAAEEAYQAADPVDDIYGSADYKRHLARVLTRRALDDTLNGTRET